MIRYIKFLFLISIISIEPALGQTNIFDCDNSRKFSVYLFNTGQYELAQHELERIEFFCETDSSSQLLMLKSYRKLKHFQNANLFFNLKSTTDISQLNTKFKQEYIRLLMAQQLYSQVQVAFTTGIDIKEKEKYLIGIELLTKNWEKAYQLSQQPVAIDNFKITGLRQIAEKSYLAKRKKPYLATLLSVFIPGSGKAYSKYWGDGIVSLLFTASTSIFAYRAFNKYGTDKVYPWIIGSLAVSYYAANIYGGNRAAVHYNDNLDNKFIHDTEQLLFSDY